MAEKTAIAWCDSTFNPWWGCTKVAPGCDNCYAAALDKRSGGDFWNDKPRAMSATNWKKPLKWNREATGRHLVFCGSMCDVFDKNAPDGQRARLWYLIRRTPNLTWLLLTKRASNIEKYLPYDWGDGYENVWLGVTVEDKEHGLARAKILNTIPARLRFLSCEPLLEDLGYELSWIIDNGIYWVIVGGESGPNARPMEPVWVDSIRTDCEMLSTPFFFKQWGGNTRDKGGHLLNGEICQEFPTIM